MAAGVHFIFELLKIGVLSATYGTVVFFIIKLIRPGVIKNNKHFWSRCLWAVYVVLFVFMFTYWGNHGLGDSYYIPIGHYKVVDQGDETAYIENAKTNQLEIGKFSYDDRYLYAEIANKNQINNDYVVWNLQTDRWQTYSANSYLALSKANKTISPANFKNFNDYYDEYWSRWRFWLLP